MIKKLRYKVAAWWERHIVSHDEWYGWADQRLDEIERDKRPSWDIPAWINQN